MADLYLAHADADRALAHRLRRAFADRGTPCHADERRMGDRAALPAALTDTLAGCAGVVVLATPAGCASPQVRAELDPLIARGDGHLIAVIASGITPAALAETWPALARLGAHPLPDTPNETEIGRAVGRALLVLRPGGRLRHETVIDFSDVQLDGDRLTAWVRLGDRAGEFTAPLGPTEADKLRWYLESYYRWPAAEFEKRARSIEDELPMWGSALWRALLRALGSDLAEWLAATETGRRLLTLRMAPPGWLPMASANVDRIEHRAAPGMRAGARSAMARAVSFDDRPPEQIARDTAATAALARLLALPWELIGKDGGHLFQRDPAVDVRRVIVPRDVRAPLSPRQPPIRVLVVVARPDDAGLIDPRASADGLIDAVTPLGGAVELSFLRPPTVDALAEALRRVPYDVLHFDGHGVYHAESGRGYLCFEHRNPDKRRAGATELIDGVELRRALGDRRLPLAFLEACQTAQAGDRADAAVASALLTAGAESVIAMSHSVLVTTAKIFTEAFYRALIGGRTVAEAVTVARQVLAANRERGAGLRLTDWYVPLLFQRGEDPVLWTGGRDIHADPRAARDRAARHATLPTLDTHDFVGRLHERLALERALEDHPVAVVVGMGGQGKTTLAAELARWLVRCERFYNAACVSMEQSPPVEGVLGQIGRALLGPKFVVPGAGEEAIAAATGQIVDHLHRHPGLVVFDNFETLLPPPADAPAAEQLTHEPKLSTAMLGLAWTLAQAGQSRVLITCREPLSDRRFTPGKSCHVLRLGPLPVRDAIELVGQLCRHAGVRPEGAEDEALEELVRAVGCHARSLVRLPELLRERGIAAVTGELHALMAELDARYPDERDRSLLASLRLSLDRLPRRWRALLPPLGLLRVGVSAPALGRLLDLEPPRAFELVVALEDHGFGSHEMGGGYVRFHPALPVLMAVELRDTHSPAEVSARWDRVVDVYREILGGLQSMSTGPQVAMAVALCTAELPNLLRVLDHLAETCADDADQIASAVEYATALEGLLQNTPHRRALAGVAARRAELTRHLHTDEWNHALHLAAMAVLERHLEAGRYADAHSIAEDIQARSARAAVGGNPYPGAALDRAQAVFFLGRILQKTGRTGEALEAIDEARALLETLVTPGDQEIDRLLAVCLTESADCLADMGRLSEAAARYERAIEVQGDLDDPRGVAVARGQLATIRLRQGNYAEALAGHRQARDTFQALNEPIAVAAAWHQMGITLRLAGRFSDSEDAFKEAIPLKLDHDARLEAASSMSELAIVLDAAGDLEESVAWDRRALVIRAEEGHRVHEAISRNNLADGLRRLGRLDEAAIEARQAAVIKDDLGVSAEPWTAWTILHDIHRDRGETAAAAEARARAVAWYAHYRGGGGEAEPMIIKFFSAIHQALASRRGAALAFQFRCLGADHEVPPDGRDLAFALSAVCRGDTATARAALDTLSLTRAFELDLLLTGRWPDAPPADPPPVDRPS